MRSKPRRTSTITPEQAGCSGLERVGAGREGMTLAI
jgi:hypothetical protein